MLLPLPFLIWELWVAEWEAWAETRKAAPEETCREAPPVFGDEGFGSGAGETLKVIASPSVWFPGFTEYVNKNEIKPKAPFGFFVPNLQFKAKRLFHNPSKRLNRPIIFSKIHMYLVLV